MNMDQKTKYILGGFAILALGIGIGKLIFARGQSGNIQAPEAATSTVSALAPQTQSNSPQQIQPSADASANKLAACIASVQLAAAKQGTGYEHGDILVSFDSSLTYPEAMAILDSFGLAPHNSASSKTDFASHHWLVVTVSPNEEFKEICILRGQKGIKYTGLNYTFKLAE